MTEGEKSELVKAIGPAAEKALDLLEKLIAGPLIEGSGMLTDKVEFWRFKNKVNIMIKAHEYLKEKGIATPKDIPIKDLTTLLEYSSFEQDESMKETWANLLANTLNPNNKFNSCHIFCQLLNQLSINEINILNYLFENCFIQSSEHRPYINQRIFLQRSGSDHHTNQLLMDNLLRMKLIEEEPPTLEGNSSSTKSSFIEDDHKTSNQIVFTENFRISNFGVELMRQVRL